MAIHSLKTHTEYWIDVHNGLKAFEYRKNDRDFKAGDVLVLRCYDQIAHEYTGNEITANVTYVLTKAPGLPEGYCIMGIEVIG